jgi:predicted dehydrogenase
MAPTIADCEAMRDVCRAEGVQLMLAYRLHFDEATIAALEIVQSGQIGRPKLFTSLLTQQVRPDDIRTRNQPGAGGLFDLGVYPINAARHLFQAEPLRVLCSITRGDDRFAGVDASAAATLIFSEERIAQFSVSLDSFARSSYRVLGESGELAVDPGYAYDEGLRHVLMADGRRIEQTFPKRDQFGAQIAAFSAALLEHREAQPSAEEGLRDVRVVQALLQAAATGRAVDLAPLPPGPEPSRRQVRAKPGVSAPQAFKAPAPTQS